MITFAQLEVEVARRCGPFVTTFSDRQIPSTAKSTFAYFPELRSTIDLDSVTNLWALRRGVCWDPNSSAFDDYDDIPIADRQRLVNEYDPEQGQVFVDRPWGEIPESGEVFEFHHLNPAYELRPAIRAGLRRCFFTDTIQALVTDAYGNIDLTAQAFWIISPDQVLSAAYGWYRPYHEAPFQATMMQGHVMLLGTSGPYLPANVWVTALRPVWSLVNGEDSETGPASDWDTLNVDLDYAASAGHIEAWHLFPSRLAAAATGGLQATQQMAAREFTRQSLIWGPSPNRRVGFSEVVGLPLMGSVTR